ncbi:MAG: stalk domain-containing protein [Peptococcaceae bacterium]|nr:stalk domain-containing protein [Peptococcaceae bacterium]
MYYKEFMARVFRSSILCGMVSMLCFGAAFAEDAPVKTAEEGIAPGVIHESYSWKTNYGPIVFEALKCDLNNPNLDLRLVAGRGEYTERATVSAMAQNTNATAMLNGDFFNMALEGAPIGPSIVNGSLASSPAVIQGIYSLGISGENVASIEAMSYNGSVTAQDGASFPIDGLNKTYYWHDPSGAESHTNTIQMYNDMWGSRSRGHANNTEVLVNADGIVEQISEGKTFPWEVPDTKTILQVNGTAETFIKAHCPIGSKLSIVSQVLPDKNWKFLVGGHALLVDNGAVVPYTKDLNALAGIRARTAAGVSADGKTLWFVCAEGRTGRSVGAHLSTLGYFMQSLGASRAVNLDGGGSTTMVLKHYMQDNYSTVIAPEGNGMMRPVVNGIGIYNSAPIGPVAGYDVTGPEEMVVGETVGFTISNATDNNYHKLAVNAGDYSITSVNGMGGSTGLYYLGLKPGTETLRFTEKNGATHERTIRILGEEGFTKLRLEADQFAVSDGNTLHLRLYGTKKDGSEVRLDPRVATWQLDGFAGSAESGTITVDSVGDAMGGTVTASIGGLSADYTLGNAAYDYLDLYVGEQGYTLNGSEQTLDQPPIIQNDRTLVPLRVITEALGGSVEWYGKYEPISIDYKGHHIELTIDNTRAIVDGDTVEMDTPARIAGDRTLIPIRFVSEHLGMNVEYDGATRCVHIVAQK